MPTNRESAWSDRPSGSRGDPGTKDLTHLSVVILDRDFLFADGAPKLDGQLADVFLFALHAHDGQAKEGLLHVELHLVIIEAHDPIEGSEGALLNATVVGLSGLADDLHDVIALALVLEVGPYKLQRIAQGGDGREAHVRARLFLSRSLDDGGQDGVGVLSQAISQVGIVRLTDEADRGQGRLLEMGGPLADVLYQRR